MKVNLPLRPCLFFLSCIVFTALVLTVWVPAGHALKPGEVSLVAEVAAGMRAIGAMDPDEKVRNPDYLAEKFLTPTFWFFGPLRKDYKKAQEFIKFYRMSSYYTANAFTWHVDGVLKNMGANGLQQVVDIGAGFNSHAYRFGNRMPGVRFFEVDLPATQNRKKEMVTSVLGALPETVAYVPIDYRTRPIFDALKQAGYDENKKTLFIWVGGARYTDETVVDQTMRSIAGHSGPGSEVVFDYLFDEVVKGNFDTYRGAWYASVRLDAAGEPWTFGIAEGKAGEFVAQRGLEIISDLGARELAEKYLVRSDGKPAGRPTPYIRILHAGVSR